MPRPQEQQIEGLPPGAIVRPIQRPRQQQIEGLPPGAIVRPIQRPAEPPEEPQSLLDEVAPEPRNRLVEALAENHPTLAGLLEKGIDANSALSRGALDTYVVGPAKGLAGSVLNLTDAVSPRMSHMVTDPLREKLKPQGIAQKVGSLAEQAAEYMIPEAAIGKGVGAAKAGLTAARLGPKAIRAGTLLAEMGLEGAGTGAVSAMQGQDVKTGAAIGAVTPLAARALAPMAEALTERVAPKIGNSLIRPRDVQYGFGKNPGRAVAEVGVTKDMPTLVTKLQSLKKATGQEIDRTLSTLPNQVKTIDLKPLVEKPIDAAIQEALAKPIGAGKQQLLTDLIEMRNDFLFTRGLDADGKLTNAAARTMTVNPLEATQFKRAVGDSTRWTGSAFDRDINQVRAEIYSNIRKAVEKEVPGVKALNGKYADALEAQTAAARRALAGERNNPLSLSDLLIGGASGLGTAMAGGGLKSAVTGIGVAGLSKLERSTLGRTAELAAAKGMARLPLKTARNVGLAGRGRKSLFEELGDDGN